MDTSILKIIKGRKSVRTFDGRSINSEDMLHLEQYASTITNPFDIPVRFVFLDAKEYGLSSPVLSGETMYVAGAAVKKPYADVAFGFSFEKLVLYAWSLGIGTTWIGGTMKREVFEKAAHLMDNEFMPCVSPLGYPAKKRSLKETMMRKGVGADSRMPVDKLFFENNWSNPLSEDKQKEIVNLAEIVRWAPSAVNKQPWRFVISGNAFHVYVKHDKNYISEKTGDLQKVDVGIALCHLVLGLEEQAEQPEIVIDNPSFTIPGEAEYVATVKRSFK